MKRRKDVFSVPYEKLCRQDKWKRSMINKYGSEEAWKEQARKFTSKRKTSGLAALPPEERSQKAREMQKKSIEAQKNKGVL